MSDTSTPPTSTSTPNPSNSSDGIFKKWSREFALMTGLGISEKERLHELHVIQRKTCEKQKKDLMKYSPAVVFMLKRLELSGCAVTSKHLRCETCDYARAGGFLPSAGITVLCAGQFFSKKHMEDTMVHELIHMYDQCMFKVDWNNLRHHACSEIRANNLGGDCRWTRELRRGHFTFTKQHQACVRRRAAISVAANPGCPDQATAERAVNEVWDSCFDDTRPFDEIY